jgi:hypothetical protein
MTARRIRYESEPMTLGNARELGVRSLDVSGWLPEPMQAARATWRLRQMIPVSGDMDLQIVGRPFALMALPEWQGPIPE